MIVAGFGFNSDATGESLASAFAAAAGGRDVSALAAPADKCAAPVIRSFARSLGLEVHAVSPEALSAARTLTRSTRSLAARETGSVAEAAALAAAAPGARLCGPRAISKDRRATCALAERNPG